MTEPADEGTRGQDPRPDPDSPYRDHVLTDRDAASGGPQDTAGWAYPPHSGPVRAVQRQPPWRPTSTEIRGAAAIVAALVIVGLLVGLLWYQLVPTLHVRVLEDGRQLLADQDSERVFAADGWYFVLTLGVGLLAGAGAWFWRRVRGPSAMVALALGGVLGALLTWWLGHQLGPSEPTADDIGAVVAAPLKLRATAAVVVEPFAAVVVYLIATAFAARDDLGRFR